MSAAQQDILSELRSRISQIESSSPQARKRVSHEPVAVSVKPDAHQVGEITVFEDEVRNALKKIERLCTLREQSSAELVKRLQKDNYSLEAAEEAVSRAQSWGLVDDLRYADVHVRCRLAAGKGLSGIARELSELDIDANEVDEYNEAVAQGDEWELERALEVLNRKPPRSKNVRESAYRRLVQKGYSSSTSSRAARIFTEQLADR